MGTKKIMILIFIISIIFTSCKDDSPEVIDVDKPEISISVSPQSGLKYGDEILITGTLTDKQNLKMYSVIIKDNAGNILFQKDQMLLGKSFLLDEKIPIPLPKNPVRGDLKIEVKVINSKGGIINQEFILGDVDIPNMERLYLILESRTVEMVKNGNVFEIDDTFSPADKGFISISPTKSGLYWGMNSNGEIEPMGKNAIQIGGNEVSSFKLSFNPYTFELIFGEKRLWVPLPDSDTYYILGTISGHWMDGNITTEKEKMKMKGFESGNIKYYSWVPPEGDNPETGMWGSISDGIFRFKKGGANLYILWNGREIVSETNDNEMSSFYTSTGGFFEIRIYFENDICTKVQLLGSDRSLEYTQKDGVKVNGIFCDEKIDFAGNELILKNGENYIYESIIYLTKGQKITSSSVNLSKIAGDEDLFSGIGNNEWILKCISDNYTIRVDIFSGAFYATPRSGYPDVIYMDGWSWGKTASSSPVVWDINMILPLINNSHNIYESTFYNWGWGGDIKFYLKHPQEVGATIMLPNTNFTSDYVNMNDPNSFLLPSSPGKYKISVDLKKGVEISSDNKVIPLSTEKFKLIFTAL